MNDPGVKQYDRAAEDVGNIVALGGVDSWGIPLADRL